MSGNGDQGPGGYSDPWDLLDYPCRYEIKAMGRQTTRFNALVQSIVSRHIETDELLLSQTRSSRYGKYISVTCIIRANSKSQIHAIYADLAACPEVLMTL